MRSNPSFRLWRIDGNDLLAEIKTLVGHYTNETHIVTELAFNPKEYASLLKLTAGCSKIAIVRDSRDTSLDYLIKVHSDKTRPIKTIAVYLNAR